MGTSKKTPKKTKRSRTFNFRTPKMVMSFRISKSIESNQLGTPFMPGDDAIDMVNEQEFVLDSHEIEEEKTQRKFYDQGYPQEIVDGIVQRNSSHLF